MEEEAYRQNMALGRRVSPPPFTLRLFGELAALWGDWKQGIPPTREWRGRGAQNPRLLLAFATLERAHARAMQDLSEPAR